VRPIAWILPLALLESRPPAPPPRPAPRDVERPTRIAADVLPAPEPAPAVEAPPAPAPPPDVDLIPLLRAWAIATEDPIFVAALAELGRGGPLDDVLRDFFVSCLDLRRSPEFRLAAVEALLAWPEAVDILRLWYPREPCAAPRAALLRAFPPEALLEVLAADPEPGVRRFAAEAVLRQGTRDASPALRAALATEHDPEVAEALRTSIELLERPSKARR
jgi:hypothetical protein